MALSRGTYEYKTCRTTAAVGGIPIGFTGSGAPVLSPACPGKSMDRKRRPAGHQRIQTLCLSGGSGRTPSLAVGKRGPGLASAPDLHSGLLEDFLPGNPRTTLASSADQRRPR